MPTEPLAVYALFGLCALAILYAGTQISKYGDAIAEKTGLGRTWIGLVLLATVTSLPELITGMSSVILHDFPDIAVGSILGSCACNVLIIALLDVLCKEKPVSREVHEGHNLSAGFGQLMLGLVLLSLVVRVINKFGAPESEAVTISIGWIDPTSIVLLICYLVAMRMVFQFEKRRIAEFAGEIADELIYGEISLRKAVTLFLLNSLIIVFAGIYLPELGNKIATISGIGDTFVGSFLIAISTSLPEIVVSLTSARLGAFDMAVGNLLGSNLFNLGIMSLNDIAYLKGPILDSAQPAHLVSGITAIVMTAIAMIGLTYRAEKKKLPIAWDSILLLLCYIIGTVILYQMSSQL